jgi:hypothetical protein
MARSAPPKWHLESKMRVASFCIHRLGVCAKKHFGCLVKEQRLNVRRATDFKN